MRKAFSLLVLLASVWALSGCSSNSYPADKIKESLLEICRKEYGIESMEVKIEGKTIGVFLPLSKLFAADFKETAITGKVRNIETLFEPSPEALEKVEDVLFSISRVLLSTDKPFDFYVLEATDVEKTGMQLVLSGAVNDIKRVRVWDISRNEYRKRVIHELRLNRAVLWNRPVRAFFEDLEKLTPEALSEKHFAGSLPADAINNMFMHMTAAPPLQNPEWEITDIRSIPIQRTEALVHVKTNALSYAPAHQYKGLQYLFLISMQEEQARIMKVIPFQYADENGGLHTVPFPAELRIDQSLSEWDQEFPLEEIRMGPFLAQQLTRRAQAITASDERVQNTFHDVKIAFDFQEQGERSHFSLNIEAALRDFNHYSRTSPIFHEDMLYLLSLISREFVDVLRSYQFDQYGYLQLRLAQESQDWILGRDDLELFRKKKIDLPGLLSLPKIAA